MKRIAISWLFSMCCLLLGPRPLSAAPRGDDASVGLLVGQHFLVGDLDSTQAFPALDFKFGLRLSDWTSLRVDLGGGFTTLKDSAKESFNGADLALAHGSLSFLFTPALGERVRLVLGGGVGLWFSALMGTDLLGTTGGSATNYLEALSVSYSLIAGLEVALDRSWALVAETRANLAQIPWAGGFQTGGITVSMGCLLRFGSYQVGE